MSAKLYSDLDPSKRIPVTCYRIYVCRVFANLVEDYVNEPAIGRFVPSDRPSAAEISVDEAGWTFID
jgi:hypothetical protein